MKVFRESAVLSLRRSASNDAPKLNKSLSSSSSNSSVKLSSFDRQFQFLILDSVTLRGSMSLRSNSIRTKTWILRHTGTEKWKNVTLKCEIAKEIPWFEYYCKIENSKNVVEPGSTFTVSVTFYVPKSSNAASLRVPFRLTNDADKTFGPRLLLEGSILSSIAPLGLVMMPRDKYGYNTDVLIMLINLAFLARKQHGLYEDMGYDVNQVLDQERFVKSLATSLRYQLCLIPESFQISMMNTTQQFIRKRHYIDWLKFIIL